MSKKKPLPYAARYGVQEALEANSEAIHSLEPVIRGRVTDPEEKMRRVALAVNNIQTSILKLTNVMSIPGGER